MNGTDSSGCTASELGTVEVTHKISSSLGPFKLLPSYQTRYPEMILRALGELYMEYNYSFAPLVSMNREWETDYQFCLANGFPVNCGVQIDMMGLTTDFLESASNTEPDQLKESLRGMIFEIENSLAMYQLLERIFARSNESFFQPRFRRLLDTLRVRFERPVALLAVTDPKYNAMMSSEFGISNSRTISDSEVKALTGFDRFFSPDEFRRHVKKNNGSCRYLLYARTSDPVSKLRDPSSAVEHPLLSDPAMRRVIKANSITFNVDAPEWPLGDERSINDTKGYMRTMRMAYPIASEEDLLSHDLIEHIRKGRAFHEHTGTFLSPGFHAFLKNQAGASTEVAQGKRALRCKPAKGTYGCYGHITGAISERNFRQDLRNGIKKRGPYVVQLELPTPRIINTTDGVTYSYMDRNFFGFADGKPFFMGGLRSLMPTNTMEAAKGRNHGNSETVWGEIIG